MFLGVLIQLDLFVYDESIINTPKKKIMVTKKAD